MPFRYDREARASDEETLTTNWLQNFAPSLIPYKDILLSQLTEGPVTIPIEPGSEQWQGRVGQEGRPTDPSGNVGYVTIHKYDLEAERKKYDELPDQARQEFVTNPDWLTESGLTREQLQEKGLGGYNTIRNPEYVAPPPDLPYRLEFNYGANYEIPKTGFWEKVGNMFTDPVETFLLSPFRAMKSDDPLTKALGILGAVGTVGGLSMVAGNLSGAFASSVVPHATLDASLNTLANTAGPSLSIPGTALSATLPAGQAALAAGGGLGGLSAALGGLSAAGSALNFGPGTSLTATLPAGQAALGAGGLAASNPFQQAMSAVNTTRQAARAAQLGEALASSGGATVTGMAAPSTATAQPASSSSNPFMSLWSDNQNASVVKPEEAWPMIPTIPLKPLLPNYGQGLGVITPQSIAAMLHRAANQGVRYG